jgi:hypothetical protein
MLGGEGDVKRFSWGARRPKREGTTMIANVGGADRVIRVVVGVVIIAVGIYFKSWWGVIGVLPLPTALVRFCPGYLPFGLSTARTQPK